MGGWISCKKVRRTEVERHGCRVLIYFATPKFTWLTAHTQLQKYYNVLLLLVLLCFLVYLSLT